jgi:preprotein translocase subunit SecA
VFSRTPCPYTPQVKSAGGLLVLGVSLQEGQRIELQLRGRAGRQGDPGTTQLLFDVTDPLLASFGMQGACLEGCEGWGAVLCLGSCS